MHDNIKKLEEAIRGLDVVDARKKMELLVLVESLKADTAQLAELHGPIARLTQSISEFEGAHPKLVEIVDEISTMLSRIGI